jgi:hypothetical protein
MTTTPPVHPALDTGDAVQAGCTVCDHILARHDPIGRRFCDATQTQALSRHCICR